MENEENTPEFDPFASEKVKSRRTPALLAGFALLVALAVAGWSGWLWWEERRSAGEGDEVARAVERLAEEQARLEAAQAVQGGRLETVEGLDLASGLTRLDDALEQARSVAGSDRARLAGLEASLDELSERLEGLESRVAAVVVRGESPRQGLELAEVDYLLRSANERLRLYGDARTAERALSLADEQLAAMDDPVYLPVRQAIAAAKLSLEEIVRPDTIALTETLGRLQSRIPALPFPGEVTVRTESGAVDTVEDPGVWERFKTAIGGLVSVQRRDPDESLVSLADKDTIRQGLWLQIESARLALLRQNDNAFHAALERAAATVDSYFDADAPAVTRFLDSLERLEGTSLTVVWPDISEPWTRLQSIRTVREAATETTPSPTASPPPAPPPAGEVPEEAEETPELSAPDVPDSEPAEPLEESVGEEERPPADDGSGVRRG